MLFNIVHKKLTKKTTATLWRLTNGLSDMSRHLPFLDDTNKQKQLTQTLIAVFSVKLSLLTQTIVCVNHMINLNNLQGFPFMYLTGGRPV